MLKPGLFIRILSNALRVRLNHSTKPSDCGWYGVVLVFCIPRRWQTSL